MSCCLARVDGSAPGSGGSSSEILDAQGANEVASTTDFDWYAFTVPAGRIRALGMLRLSLDGYILNNAGSRAFGLEISIGGVVLYSSSFTSMAGSVNPRAWAIELWMRAPTLATATLRGIHRLSGAATSVVGFPALSTTFANDQEFSSPQVAPVADWTIAQSLRVRITPDLSSPAYAFGRHGATLELLQQ